MIARKVGEAIDNRLRVQEVVETVFREAEIAVKIVAEFEKIIGMITAKVVDGQRMNGAGG